MTNSNIAYEYSGTVHEVGGVQTFASGFKKAEFVCKASSGEYVDYAVFEAKRDLADRAAKLKVGDNVTVKFVLAGREWDGPKGRRWFSSAVAVAIERLGGGEPERAAGDAPAATGSGIESVTQDDMPF